MESFELKSEKTALRRSWVEIDSEQLEKNYRAYLSALPDDTRIMAVVKADAYGHGDINVALKMQSLGVDLFAVSNIDEAVGIRRAGITGEILILGYTPPEMADVLYEYGITQALLSEEYAFLLSQSTDKKLKCQFAIDTGMNRIGLDARETDRCEQIIRKYYDIFELNGIFTHLCVADSTDKDDFAFTENQISLFEKTADSVSDLALPYTHCLNSAGGLYHPTKNRRIGSIVRLGIILYGLRPDIRNVLPDGIQPVLSWKSVVSMVKTVNPGEFVGYGRSYRADKKIKLATIPTGYADGYHRALSNKWYVLINGKKAPIVGKVCMDQMMVDVSDIENVGIGDEVTLLGRNGELSITADSMAECIGTIGYEIICDMSKRVNKLFE